MEFTTDKLRSMVRKWQSLIEAHVDVKTTDGYVLRLFCIGFTKKRMNQLKKTCYANNAQVKAIRKKMTDIMTREAQSCPLKQPKFDLTKLLEVHADSGKEDTGAKVEVAVDS